MLIYCPKCRQGYNVGEDLIPEEGRKLRCSKCGEVFRYDRRGEVEAVKMPPAAENDETDAADEAAALSEENNDLPSENNGTEEPAGAAVEEPGDAAGEESEKPGDGGASENAGEEAAAEPEPEIDEPVDINDIFRRLSEQTEGLFEKEKKLTLRERLWLKFKTLTGWNIHLKLKYILAFLAVIAALSLYNNRYDIARRFPWTAPIYGVFGAEAQILGEGLEFQNIDWIYFNDEEAPRLEIKGFINNMTNRTLDLPTVHVEMLDENTNLLKSQNQQPEQESLKAKSRLPLNIVVTKPSPTTKYVFLTFVEIED